MKGPILFFLSLALFAGCAENDLADRSYGDTSAMTKVLIAGTDSPFKQAIIRNIIGSFAPGAIGFRVTGLKSLPEVVPDDYKAIVVISPLHAGKIDRRAEVFIRSQGPDRKIVLFYTKGGESRASEWGKVDLGVDTVSSASRNERIIERAQQLTGLIKTRTGK